MERHRYYMEIARVETRMGRCPFYEVGACIVEEDRVIGKGSNRFPPWFNLSAKYAEKHDPELFMTTAILDAYISTGRQRLDNCTLYVTKFPTNFCAMIIVQVGLREIFYESDDNFKMTEVEAARKILEKANYRIEANYIYKLR